MVHCKNKPGIALTSSDVVYSVAAKESALLWFWLSLIFVFL